MFVRAPWQGEYVSGVHAVVSAGALVQGVTETEQEVRQRIDAPWRRAVTASLLLPLWEAGALGFAGGLAPDALRIVNARHEGPPAFLRSAFFWTSLVVLGALGGGVAILSHPASPGAALALGYSAPSIVSALGAKAETNAGLEPRGASTRQWSRPPSGMVGAVAAAPHNGFTSQEVSMFA